MKKLSMLTIGIICAIALSAEQMPNDYYKSINGKKNKELKTALSKIMCSGNRYQYGPQEKGKHKSEKVDPTTGITLWHVGDPKFGTWTAFPISDVRSDGTIWDMYSNYQRYYPAEGRSGASLDIEHSLPKSWWGGKKGCESAFCDLYILMPADHLTNVKKGNNPPGILKDSNMVNNGVFFMGKDIETGTSAFDVIDEYKGDFARAYFYTVTTYEKVKWDSKHKKYVDFQKSYLGFNEHLIKVLLDWHRKDPVSQKEVERLNVVSDMQHNRNAFTEYPDLVEYIWGNKKGQTVDLSNLKCTTDGTYEFPVSNTNPTAYKATNVTLNGFTANWSNTGSASYSLNVFTRTETGKNDTLLNIPTVNKDILNGTNLTLHESGGAKITSSSGINENCTSALTLGVKDGGTRYFQISGISFNKPAELVLKCSISRFESTSQKITVSADNNVIKTITLTANDSFPRFSIPKGTRKIKIESADGNRIAMQSVFVICGDYKVTETSLAGYPKTVTGFSYQVDTNNEGTVYYNVTPAGLRTTNTVKVKLGDKGSAIDNIFDSQEEAQKIIEDGKVVIIRNGMRYSILGTRL